MNEYAPAPAPTEEQIDQVNAALQTILGKRPVLLIFGIIETAEVVRPGTVGVTMEVRATWNCPHPVAIGMASSWASQAVRDLENQSPEPPPEAGSPPLS